MEAQKLLDTAPFPPAIVEALKWALEEAWASIASSVAPERVADTRMGLAHALVARAAAVAHDRQSLKAAALEAIKNHPPRVSPSDP
jgi:hypothetical protein